MSRKKNAKGAAKRKNASKVNNNLITIQKIQKEFVLIPNKLGNQLAKEINALRQKENKLKVAVNKNKTQAANFENRMKSAAKLNTATAKKQLKTAKNAHTHLGKEQQQLQKQLAEVTTSLDATTETQAKLFALHKHLSQFEKEWAKKSKLAKTTAKAKSKPKKSKSHKQAVTHTEEKPLDTFHSTIDNVRIEETAELVS